MAAAIPTVLRLSSLDPDAPRRAGPPAPAIPGDIPGCGPPAAPGCPPAIPGYGAPAIPGVYSGPPGPPGTPDPAGTPAPAGTPVPPALPAGAPVPPVPPAPSPSGAGRGIDWVPPGATKPRARANSRTTHRLAAPSRSLAWARMVATDWMAP